MANDWVTDQKWRDIKHQDLPDWVKRRVKELDHHSFIGKSFEYRREPTTGRYQRRLRSIPVNTSKLHRDGIALGKLGKHEQAIAYFDEAIRINETDHAAWHRKGIELNALEKYNEAMKCFEKAIQINSNDRFAWNHRGVSLRELEKYDEALRSCNEAIKINNKYPFGWYTKGSILHHLGNVTEAKTCFQRALKLAPDNDMYKKRLSGIEELEQTNRIKERRTPVNTSKLHRDGIALGKLGKHKEAIVCFDEAIRINEMDHTAWHRKGIELNALEKYNEAMECFERAIRINPRDKFAWNHRALSLCRSGNYKEAIKSNNEAIKIDDTYPFAWRNRAVIAAYLEDFEDFEKSYRKARQLDPKGLNNQFFAEYLPDPPEKIPDKKGDIKLFVYYCCDLCMVHLRMKEMSETLKYVMDLRNYANEKTRAILTPLIEELEFSINGGIAVTEELIKRADLILHQVKMGW